LILLIWSSLARLRSLDTTPNNSETVGQIILKATQQLLRSGRTIEVAAIDMLSPLSPEVAGKPTFQALREKKYVPQAFKL
jgi:hypothetical protein